MPGAEAAVKEEEAEQVAVAAVQEEGGEQEAVDADEETGAGEEDDELELSQATTLRLPSSAEELGERKKGICPQVWIARLNDAERRAFLEAFEADEEKRSRDEALMSALLAYDEPTSPTSASESEEDICRQPRDWQDIR